jgi:hypothetical protein
MNEIDRQKHAYKILTAIEDYHRDRKRRTRRPVATRKIAATASCALQDRRMAADRSSATGVFSKLSKNGLFLKVFRVDNQPNFGSFVPKLNLFVLLKNILLDKAQV